MSLDQELVTVDPEAVASAAEDTGQEEPKSEEELHEEQETASEEEAEAETEEESEEGDAEESAEEDSEEDSEEGKKKKDSEEEEQAAPELTDETEVVLEDGTELTIGELKQAYGVLDQANKALERGEDLHQKASQALQQLGESPADTLLAIFTAKNDGNREKGVQQVVDLASKIVAWNMQREQLPEAERKAYEKDQEVQALRSEIERLRKEQEERANSAADMEATKAVTEEITEALRTNQLDAQDPQIVQMVAGAMLDAEEIGIKLTAGVAASRVKKQLAKQKQQLAKGLTEDDIPEEIRKKLRKKDLAAAKKKQTKKPTPQGRPPMTAEEKSSRRRAGLFS